MSSFFDSLNFPQAHKTSAVASTSSSGAASTSRHASSRAANHGRVKGVDGPSSAIPGPSSRSPFVRTPSGSSCIDREDARWVGMKDQHGLETARRSISMNQETTNDDDEGAVEREEGPRVFWDVPPSTFIRDWEKSNPPDSACKGSTVSAGSTRGGKWSRQPSTASTSSTTSASTCRTNSTSSAATTGGIGALRHSKSRTTPFSRRSKSLRSSKTAAGFRRHASTSAVLGETRGGGGGGGAGVIGSNHAGLATLNGRDENQAERVNKLLADLGLTFQEELGRSPDFDDEDDVTADVSMDSVPTIRGGSRVTEEVDSTPVKAVEGGSAQMSSGKTITQDALGTCTPLSASQLKASMAMRPGGPTSSWERTVTFPPSGSPAAGGPQFRTGETIPAMPDVDLEDEDGFGCSEWDEALLAHLPLLAGIEEDQEGYFSGQSRREEKTEMFQAGPSTITSGGADSGLGKRRKPPTPSPDDRSSSSNTADTTVSRLSSSTKAQRPNPTSSIVPSGRPAQNPVTDPAVKKDHQLSNTSTRSRTGRSISPIKSMPPSKALPDVGNPVKRSTHPTDLKGSSTPTSHPTGAGGRTNPFRAGPATSDSSSRSNGTSSTATSPSSSIKTTVPTTLPSRARGPASTETFYASSSSSSSSSAKPTTNNITKKITTTPTTNSTTNSRSTTSKHPTSQDPTSPPQHSKSTSHPPHPPPSTSTPALLRRRRRGDQDEGQNEDQHVEEDVEEDDDEEDEEDEEEEEGIDTSDLDCDEIERVMSANGY